MDVFLIAILLLSFVFLFAGQSIFDMVLGGSSSLQATASHILMKDEAKLLELKSILDKSDDVNNEFASLAKQYSTCPSKSKGGSLGTFRRGQMVPEFDNAVFTGEVGKVLGPIKTQFGYHLILVQSRLLLSSSSSFRAAFSSSSSPSLASNINITIEKTKTPKKKLPAEELQFGRTFSDHMLEIKWTKEKGWSTPAILPYHNLVLDPASVVFHYAAEIFEGMKAYIDKDGHARLFRPDLNMKRLNKSANRLYLPEFDSTHFLECIKELVKTEKDWIPNKPGYSLYIRPTMIGTAPYLGVGPSAEALFYVICSPVGPYYKSGFAPVTLLTTNKYVRAWPGGTGEAKCGGNYAPGIRPQVEANVKGYAQVLWTFGPEEYVTEVGTMNFFCHWVNKKGEEELITAPLDGTILEGVTRASIIELAKQDGIKVTEKNFTVNDLLSALKEGRLLECFGSGTAAIVSPVKGVNHGGQDYVIPLGKNDKNATGKIGPLAEKMAHKIMAIQYGEINHPWSVRVD